MVCHVRQRNSPDARPKNLMSRQTRKVMWAHTASCAGIQDCTLVLAASQFRMHRAVRTDVHLRARSNPIIEQCSQLRFAPYQLQYENLERQLQESGLAEDTGEWARVQDFDWLRSSTSPNW